MPNSGMAYPLVLGVVGVLSPSPGATGPKYLCIKTSVPPTWNSSLMVRSRKRKSLPFSGRYKLRRGILILLDTG
jgi:hypothetical protein